MIDLEAHSPAALRRARRGAAGLLLCALLSAALSAALSACASTPPAATPSPAPALSATPTPTASPSPTPLPTATPEPTQEEYLSMYIDTLTLEQKIGQLLMFGFSGKNAPSSSFVEIFTENQIGNAVLYGYNIDPNGSGGFPRAAKLIEAVKATNTGDIPMLVSIDVEGGMVSRFGWKERIPSGKKLGLENDPEKTRARFTTVGKTLIEYGMNMNLAPVLDISETPSRTFLTSRIISADAEIVSSIGSAVIEGLADGGCLSTAKHFPGHGGTQADSHAKTPVVEKTLEEMEAYDLVPFRAGVKAGVDVVLVAHISYPNIDTEHIASMSSVFITDLLRGEMGFTGIVMSDDFRMGGLTSRYAVGEAAVRFLEAGGDLILCGPRKDLQVKILAGLNEAVASGRLTEARIDESVFRILQKKMKVTAFDPKALLKGAESAA